MTEIEKSAVEATNAAIGTATEHIRSQREALKIAKMKAYCLTIFACVAVVCASVVACFSIHSQQQTIIEQQYALNMQYASLTDLLNGAEVITEENTADSGDGGMAIAGDGNTMVGGDLNG